MTRQVYEIFKFTTDKTEDVMSFTYSTGRQTQFDSWGPNYLVLTIRNNTSQASGWNLNDEILLYATGTDFVQMFWVQEVIFNDQPGTGAGSTATIICADLMARCGRIQVFKKSLTSDQTIDQLYNEFNSLMPTGTDIGGVGGDSVAAADASYTGTVLNRINLNMTTEQGFISVTSTDIYLGSRSSISQFPTNLIFARSASGTYQMGYSDIQRIALGPNYLNTCVVTPPLAVAQNATDATGIAAYGYYGAEFSTVDNSATQADSFADWQVQSRSDPDQLSFEISFSDTANDLTGFFDEIAQSRPVVTVSYKKPGSGTTYTDKQILQGFSMSVTPASTNIQVFTSPFTYNNFFVLDSDISGVLNTSRLGW